MIVCALKIKHTYVRTSPSAWTKHNDGVYIAGTAVCFKPTILTVQGQWLQDGLVKSQECNHRVSCGFTLARLSYSLSIPTLNVILLLMALNKKHLI